ncbi:MAG: sigma-54-dependent Fis family transcriptional regulator [Flavobacteriales bacterium]|nr:sigma-54-dependent Fis family transcriptional regulator [Flavobacteriales bacterium]
MAKILIVEDESSVRRVLVDILSSSFEDVEFLQASCGKEALDIIRSNDISVCLCDIKMPAPDGVEVLSTAMKEQRGVTFVMLSGHGDIDTAVDCLKKGAVDYMCKPPDLPRLVGAIRYALSRASNDTTVTPPQIKSSRHDTPRVDDDFFSSMGMIGQSSAIRSMQDMIRRLSPTDARVLVMGENGTGKELVAKSIHALSSRKDKPLVEVNCAAIPSELIESELFGHEKGAFTTALKMHKGRFEQADGGTLFLDEVGDMSLAAQAKVLRVIQEGRITRVGGDKDIDVNVRIIAATNQDLKEMIKQGRFREDLYHRLSVIELRVPPLRERREDIKLLSSYFIHKAIDENNLPNKSISDAAIEALESKKWSGNIRQLQNVIERLSILSMGDEISADDVALYASQVE